MRKIGSFWIVAGIGFLLAACNAKPAKEEEKSFKSQDFDSIRGIRYTEVKRRFSNGLSFDVNGFQQEPSWIIQFPSAKDTVLAYDPGKKVMQPFYLEHDHANVFNFAKEWFRFKLISKDSLVFQRLQVNRKQIADDIRSDVNMTFYADDYIRNKLRTTAEKLQRPSPADTVFIRNLATQANQDPNNRDLVFAGRQIATFTPLSDMVSIEFLSSVDPLGGRTRAYDYLFPKYRIVIRRAYKDFGYDFKVIVDAKGKLTVSQFNVSQPEYRETRKKVLQGITSVYLQNLLKINPGSTLGIAHASEISLIVTGRKANK
jgi:hypothetical protein